MKKGNCTLKKNVYLLCSSSLPIVNPDRQIWEQNSQKPGILNKNFDKIKTNRYAHL
jgi:hypothetical protein